MARAETNRYRALALIMLNMIERFGEQMSGFSGSSEEKQGRICAETKKAV